MGGTIEPPTMREIEAENRFLKSQLDQVARLIRVLISNIDSKQIEYELEDILEVIVGKKREQPENQKTPREMWDCILQFKESLVSSKIWNENLK